MKRFNFDMVKYLITQSVKEWQADKASRLAAALSYYTIFSLPALLVLSLAIVGQFFDQAQARDRLLDEATALLGETGGEAIGQILENAADPQASTIAAIVSLVVLLFSASGVFAQLQDAMNTVWDVQPRPGQGILATIKNRFLSFTMVLGVGFLLLVSLLLSTVLSTIGEFLSGVAPEAVLFAQVINFVVSLAGITLLFALIFKVIPDVKIHWNDVWLGAFATAVLFSMGKWAIGLYLGQSAPASSYGAAGSLIILLLWVYYSSQLLFFGAEFTQVYANRYGGRIRPDENAIDLSESQRLHQGLARPSTVQAIAERPVSLPQRRTINLPQSTETAPRVVELSSAAKRVESSVATLHSAVVNILAVPTALWQVSRRPRRASRWPDRVNRS